MRLLFLCLLVANISFAQSNNTACACCSSPYDEFSFWLGDWNVYDTNNTKIGENLVLLMQDSCLLQENWQSKGSSGTSYNYYNKNDQQWHQVWVDNQGGSLNLHGNLDGKMIRLRSDDIEGSNGIFYHEIAWSPIDNKTLSQIWTTKDTTGKVLSTLFYGIYRKK